MAKKLWSLKLQAASLSQNELFQKKTKQTGVGGHGISIQGYCIEETKCGLWYVNTPHQKRSGISRGVPDRATPIGISIGLGFWPWNFQGCDTIFQNFQVWKLVFSRISVIIDHGIHHDSMIHAAWPLIVLYDVLYYYLITNYKICSSLYIYLILFLFNSFYIQYFVYFFSSLSAGWDTNDTVWYK